MIVDGGVYEFSFEQKLGEKMELVNLEMLDMIKLKETLNKYFIKSIIDGDGDLIISGSINLYSNIDKEKDTLRFFGSIPTKHLKKEKEILNSFATRVNMASNTIKYSNTDDSIFFEYGLFTLGSVDEKFIVTTVQNIMKEVNDTRGLFPLMDEVLGVD